MTTDTDTFRILAAEAERCYAWDAAAELWQAAIDIAPDDDELLIADMAARRDAAAAMAAVRH